MYIVFTSYVTRMVLYTMPNLSRLFLVVLVLNTVKYVKLVFLFYILIIIEINYCNSFVHIICYRLFF